MSRVEEKWREKFAELTFKTYASQAKWFLNGFWEEIGGEKEAESIWKYTQKFIELDTKKKKEGNDLDEFEAHKFLESLGETMTVIALRERLREIDLDNNKRMALIEYLIFKYKKTVEQVVTCEQGGNPEEVAKAQQKVQEAQALLEEMQAKLEEQKQAEQEATRTLQEATVAAQESAKLAEESAKAAQEAKTAADELKKVEEENRKALEELNKQEESYKNQLSELERKSKEGTVVQKNKAAAELAQLKEKDPLPLRQAKINQGATLRKCEKASKIASEKAAAATEAANQAEQARKAAEQAKKAAEEAKEAAEQARLESEKKTKEAEAAFQEAMNYLNEVKSKIPAGDLWWMEREIKEAKKYLPKRKQ